jgi:hypothetical protein
MFDVYPMKTDVQFVNALEDHIRERGAMTTLLSDRAQAEISNKVEDILHAYRIGTWKREPLHQHQNPCETRYRIIKEYTKNILNRIGTPASCWFLFLEYVCYLLNHLSSEVLNWCTPLEAALGSTPDVSALLHYHFYEPIYYKTTDTAFPSKSTECRGCWVGIAEHVGDALTFKVLTADTNRLIYRSAIQTALANDNNRLPVPSSQHATGGEWGPVSDAQPSSPATFTCPPKLSNLAKRPKIDLSDLIGRTFPLPNKCNGERYRAKITKII